jgi:uncharacterized protein with von Willebrand factor type A (vWA) domain
MRRGSAALVDAMVAFGSRMRAAGIEVGPGRVEVAVRAFGCVDPRDPEEAYWALRCAFLSRREDVEAFDRAFEAFWLRQAERDVDLGATPVPAPARSLEPARGEAARREREISPLSAAEHEDHEGAPGEGVGSTYSPLERLRRMDFREWGAEELAAARPLIERIGRSMPMRRSRRTRASRHRSSIDRRATMRRAMRTEGHPLELLVRERRERPRRMVFLVDVSGSMEAYAQPLIVFCQAVRQASSSVEVFTIGTRLTRLTRWLVDRDPARALERAARSIPDWAGGTRIGANLAALNAEWGRRNLIRGAIVVIFSDGWERGEVQLLAAEMERVHRAAHAVVWVNPLAGVPDYEPLAAGMAVALPHVDRFLPGNDLRSLERLAAVLEQVADAARPGPVRRGRHRRARIKDARIM